MQSADKRAKLISAVDLGSVTRTLRDQITSNLERAWEITGRSEDELTGVMVQISQAMAKGFNEGR